MAAFMGKDVKKLKAKGGGKWKYMSEQRHAEPLRKVCSLSVGYRTTLLYRSYH